MRIPENDEPIRGVPLNKDNIWIVWGLLSIFCFYLFESAYNPSGFYLFMTPMEFIAARLQLAILFGIYTVSLKFNKSHYIKFNMQIIFYLLLTISILTGLDVNLETRSVEYFFLPPLSYFIVLIFSIKTIRIINSEQSQSIWQDIFQIVLIRKQWKIFFINVLLFSLGYIVIDYILEHSR